MTPALATVSGGAYYPTFGQNIAGPRYIVSPLWGAAAWLVKNIPKIPLRLHGSRPNSRKKSRRELESWRFL